MAKVDKRIISDNLDVEVTHVDNGYTVSCTNKNTTAPLVIRLNFEKSANLTIAAVAGVSKMLTATVCELTVQPGETTEAATLTAINADEAYSYKYTCLTQLKKTAAGAASTTTTTTTAAAAPAPAPAPAQKAKAAETAPASTSTPGPGFRAPVPKGTEETERKNLAEDLSILVHSINNGFNLQIDNTASDNTYTVILDLEASENLLTIAEGSATLEGKKVTVSVPPRSIVSAVDMPVDDESLCACELRYKAAIRKH